MHYSSKQWFVSIQFIPEWVVSTLFIEELATKTDDCPTEDDVAIFGVNIAVLVVIILGAAIDMINVDKQLFNFSSHTW